MHDSVLKDGVRYDVEHYEIHPKFVNFSVYDDYDLAMVTLQGRIQFNRNIKPICLITLYDDYTGLLVRVSGWGKLGDSQNAGLGTQLQETKVRMKPTHNCTVATSRIVKFNPASMVCAHSPGTDACKLIHFLILIFDFL